ncbi:MAG TPA: alpha/beta hydrolase [Caulobacteraceae bacterium]|jgi:acetyl esterase/lipase
MLNVVSALIIGAVAAGSAVGPAPPQTCPLHDRPPAGWEHPSQVELTEYWPPRHRMLRNVTAPTISVFLPAMPSRTGVVIAPGGGFVALSIDEEGADVARWLAGHGITAFVVKYRLRATPADQKAFVAEFEKLLGGAKVDPNAPLPGEAEATADGRAAMAWVRARAPSFGLDPARIGFLGFSAGGLMANTLAVDGVTHPAFVGSIYSPLRANVTVPADAPPMFTAQAADDPLFGAVATSTYQAWRAAHRPVELHVYAKGGHGFGLRHQGTTSDKWIDEFYAWLAAQGLAGS